MAYKYKYNILTHNFNIIKEDWATSGANIYNTNAGNVGIGTNSPGYMLDVYGQINTQSGYNIKTVEKPPTTFTLSLDAGTELEVGQYYYRVAYYTIYGDSAPSSYVGIVTTTGNERVLISNIPISTDPRVIGRKIFRNKVGEGVSYGELIATIADNTTTSYVDTKPDSTLNPSIHTRAMYAKPNLSVKYIAVDNNRSMILSGSLTVFGYKAGESVVNPGNTVLLGAYAGNKLTSGQGNTIIGDSSGQSLTTGNQNTVIGQLCLASTTTGSYNIAIGINCHHQGSAGEHNIAMGYYASNKLVGGNNIILGSYNSIVKATGSNNVNIGVYSFTLATSGSHNVSLGYSTGQRSISGSNNVFLGNYAGNWELGSGKLFIDTYDRGSEADARTKSLIYGEFHTTATAQKLYLNSNVYIKETLGIGTTSPSSLLDVAGTVTANQYKLSALNSEPSSATDTGVAGEIRITSGYIYVCVATNTWVRSQLTTW